MRELEMLKCVNCESLFTEEAIHNYGKRLGINVTRMNCPICDVKFTDGQLGQGSFKGTNNPSVRSITIEMPPTIMN